MKKKKSNQPLVSVIMPVYNAADFLEEAIQSIVRQSYIHWELIVVDDASEVAREAADLVLLKNDFSTVLAAIEEGRLIFNNLRKIALYLLSDTFSEL